MKFEEFFVVLDSGFNKDTKLLEGQKCQHSAWFFWFVQEPSKKLSQFCFLVESCSNAVQKPVSLTIFVVPLWMSVPTSRLNQGWPTKGQQNLIFFSSFSHLPFYLPSFCFDEFWVTHTESAQKISLLLRHLHQFFQHLFPVNSRRAKL